MTAPQERMSRNRTSFPLRVHPDFLPIVLEISQSTAATTVSTPSVYSPLFARHCLRAPSSPVPLPLSVEDGVHQSPEAKPRRPSTACSHLKMPPSRNSCSFLPSVSHMAPSQVLSRHFLLPTPAALPTHVHGVPEPGGGFPQPHRLCTDNSHLSFHLHTF